jgi:ABC-type uncharacterized transport system substrate-binding protein
MRTTRIVLTAALIGFLPAISSAKDYAIVRSPGAGSSARLSESLALALQAGPEPSAPRLIDLSGDGVADAARVAREANKGDVLFAVGPDAVVAVGETARSHVIALGVPNPARFRSNATFVSAYPQGSRIFEFAARRLGAKKVGILYSPSHNGEVAAELQKAAAALGLGVVRMPAASPGELVRILNQVLPNVDVLILPIDPMLFDRMSLRLIVERSSAQKKATIGFLPELPALGVTAALVADPAAQTAAAIRESGGARPAARKLVEVDSMQVTVSKRATELIGINAESLGADKIQ